MHKILVYGFAHSGTTILRKLIGNCIDVYDVPEEALYVPCVNTEKNNIVIKYPIPKLPNNFYATSHKDYKIILIIKNPYDVFGSMFKRLGHLNYKGCTIHDWARYGALFLSFRNNSKNNIFTVKYEEMFENKYKIIEDMFSFLNLPYSEKEIIYKVRGSYVTKSRIIPENEPDREGASHGAFRMWQINQKFLNKTGEGSLFLPNGVREQLRNFPITKRLGYHDMEKFNKRDN